MATGGVVGANVLPALGFGAAGVKAGMNTLRKDKWYNLSLSLVGTAATVIQSVCYGATVPAGGLFAAATSWGATGAMATPFGVAGAVIGGAAYLIYKRG